MTDLKHTIAWSAATDAERTKIVGRLIDHTYAAIERAEEWLRPRKSERRTAAKNFRLNVRRAQVRYAAVQKLAPGYTWSKIEARLSKLCAHVWWTT